MGQSIFINKVINQRDKKTEIKVKKPSLKTLINMQLYSIYILAFF